MVRSVLCIAQVAKPFAIIFVYHTSSHGYPLNCSRVHLVWLFGNDAFLLPWSYSLQNHCARCGQKWQWWWFPCTQRSRKAKNTFTISMHLHQWGKAQAYQWICSILHTKPAVVIKYKREVDKLRPNAGLRQLSLWMRGFDQTAVTM